MSRSITDRVHSLLFIKLACTSPLRDNALSYTCFPNLKLLYAQKKNHKLPEDSFDVEVGIYRIIHLTLLSESVSNEQVLPEFQKKKKHLSWWGLNQ